MRKKKNRTKNDIATEQAPFHHDVSNFGNVLENQSEESIDKQLDRYPTLVVNADYTVRFSHSPHDVSDVIVFSSNFLKAY